MANLRSTTINGSLTITGQMLGGGNSDQTPWYYVGFFDNYLPYFHVRLPLPADTSYLGWNPSILEVVGYSGTTGEKTYDFKALLNVNGYNNDWFGSQIMVNDGFAGTPFVYRSVETYGGQTRVCFSVPTTTTDAKGHLFIRWWNNQGAWNSFAWGALSTNAQSGAF